MEENAANVFEDPHRRVNVNLGAIPKLKSKSKQSKSTNSSKKEELELLEREQELQLKIIREKAKAQLTEAKIEAKLKEDELAAQIHYTQLRRKILSDKSSSVKTTISDVDFQHIRLLDWVDRQKKVTFEAKNDCVNSIKNQCSVKFKSTAVQTCPEEVMAEARPNKTHPKGFHRVSDDLLGDEIQKSYFGNESSVMQAISQPINYRNSNYLNPNLSVDDFLNATLNYQEQPKNIISKDQARARYVVSKELPDFNGDPKDWPAFIAKFKESTIQCGFTNTENLDRLAKCLKGSALDAVKSELHKIDSLPSILATLKMLYGRSDVVYNSLMEQIKNAPTIKDDKFDTLVVFAMRVKSLCDTLRTAQMIDYLNNPLLLSELVSKLTPILKMAWGTYRNEQELQNRAINVESFNQWTKKQAEIASVVSNQPLLTNISASNKINKPRKYEAFQGYHQEANTSWKNNCVCCNSEGHIVSKCGKFKNMSVSARWGVVKRYYLCIRCLGKHRMKNCGLDQLCNVEGCQQPHHHLLHNINNVTGKPHSSNESNLNFSAVHVNSNNKTENKSNCSDQTTSHIVNMHSQVSRAKFQMVPVKLSNGNGREVTTLAFLDSGSEISLIENSIIDQLGITGSRTNLRLRWTNNICREENDSYTVNLMVSNMNNNESYQLKNIRSVKNLSLPTQKVNIHDLQNFKYLSHIPTHDYTQDKAQILIGLDNYKLLVPQEIIEGSWHEPVAIRTRLGWTIFGNISEANENEKLINVHQDNDSELHRIVNDYFSLENIGIVAPKRIVETIEESKARRIMEATIVQDEDGRYVSGLLWRDKFAVLPKSFHMAERRLMCLERKFIREPELREIFNNQIDEYHSLGYMVELNYKEQNITNDKLWYLPMFLVKNPNKPSKCRLVWDAAAESEGHSLNSFLLTGPDLLTSLCSILYKFRERRYAVGGDIEKMYHQVKIKKEDQEAQRCIWKRFDGDKIHISKMTVMTFGAACSPSIAQFVKNLNASKFKEMYPRAAAAIINNHYVDDYLDSFNDVEEAKDTVEKIVMIHKFGGFNIRGFISNNNSIINDVDTRNESQLNLMSDKNEPTKVLGKLILRTIWRSNIQWDEKLQSEEMVIWKKWIEELRGIENIKIPRWYFTSNVTENVELHVFVDAGEQAAAAVAYFVHNYNSGREVTLIGSKTKVGPNKAISIPRMELQAAVIGCRLAVSIQEKHSIQISKVYYWTDSRNVLCWLRSPRRFKTFVSHRIGEIRETTNIQNWRYVPTRENPADLGTKWIASNDTILKQWFQGPSFLLEDQNRWPHDLDNLPDVNEEDLEVRCNVTTVSKINNLSIDATRFSKWSKLLRAQIYVFKFFYRRKGQPAVTPTTLKEAEEFVIRTAQLDAYGEEFDALSHKKLISKTSKIRSYSPFLDNASIIRMRSRLDMADYLSFDQRYPIILPQKHAITHLLINHYHEKYQHMNHATVLNEIKQRFAIPSLRAKIKSLRANCMYCRKLSLKPETPEMSSLPRSRIAAQMRPFTFVGLDYFGPLEIKIGRRLEKRWGCIFTCLTTRAVHLELASSLSTDSFLLVLRCFISRRGQPAEIISDNGSNFKGAANELKRIAEENAKIAMSEKYSNIEWKFNPPLAPHMGGAWERLIRSVKNALSCLILERVPAEDLLRTVLTEIEMIINSRPLTYVETSANDLESLTPNHFLLGSSSGIKPLGQFTDDPDILRKAFKRQQVIVQTFWKRFVTEYLPEISRRTKWYDSVEPIKEGDVVAIADNDIPNSWQLGRVVDAVRSHDGNVRQAVVKTISGLVKRPASKLAVLVRDELK